MTSNSAAVQGEQYGARKGEVSLFLWRKRVPQALDPTRPPVLLVHGSSMSSQPTFDLEVPDHPDYSFMDWLARLGHDVWTLDHEGYGRSTITAVKSLYYVLHVLLGVFVNVLKFDRRYHRREHTPPGQRGAALPNQAKGNQGG